MTIRSRNDELTLDPTMTWSTLVPATSRTVFTLPGDDGQAISGSTVGEVDFGVLVVVAPGIGVQLPPGIAAPLGLEILAGALVRREDRAGGAQFGAHVADGFTVGGGERRHPGAVILDHLADAPLDVVAAQQLENHILGADPVGKLPGQSSPRTRLGQGK